MKRILCFIAIAALALSLASCAGPTAKLMPEKSERILLTALFGESTSDPGISDMISEKIERDFPEIELEWERVDWGEQFSKRLNAKIASGEIPDLIIGKSQDVKAYQSIGAIGAFSPDFEDLLTKEALDAATVDGKLYGLTYNQLYQGVLYNKNIFARYQLSVPETPEQMEALVARLEKANVTPFATHFQETWYTGNILMQFAINEVFAENPDWGDRLRRGEVSFSTDAGYRAACQLVKSQLEHTWPDALGVAQSESDKRFVDGEAAMYLTGSWSVQTIQSIAPHFKVGIFPYPNQLGDAKLIVEPNTTFMKSAASPHNDLIDEVYRAILTDVTLAQTLCDFAQTDMTLNNVEATDSLKMIREDLKRYAGESRLISASVGNHQLVWDYQYACAKTLLNYLEGKATLDETLKNWDELRQESLLTP